MKKIVLSIGTLAAITALSACETTPEPEEIVEVTPPPVEQTCVPIASLRKVVIPAVTKSGWSIVSIDSPPEYIYDETTGKTTVIQNPPIERKEPWTRVIKPEEIYYVDAENKEVTDICEKPEIKHAANVAPEPELPLLPNETKTLAVPVKDVVKEPLPSESQ